IDAIRTFRDAVAVYEKVDIKRFHTDDFLWMGGSANSYGNLVNALKANDELGEAVQAIRSAVAFYEGLADEHNEPAVHKELGRWCLALSDMLDQRDKNQEAEDYRNKAFASAKNLLERQPASEEARWTLSMSQRELAQILGVHPKMVKEVEA